MTGEPSHEPALSADPADLNCPGVLIEFEQDMADLWGAFLETALDEAAAWAANDDLGWQ